MTPAVDLVALATAPKAVLHDHLDGGLRPKTILELADGCGWTPNLPATDPGALQAWFTRGAETGDILQYLATFEHTVAVLQSAEALERVAAEAVVDLAADGVVYAEIRFAPELHEALTPPEAVLNNPDPKLPELPSIVTITDAKLPQLGPLGDPLTNVQGPHLNGGEASTISREVNSSSPSFRSSSASS